MISAALLAVRGFLSGAWGYIAAAAAIAGGLLMLLAGAKKAGKDEVRADNAEKELEHAKEANAIEERVSTTPPDVRRERLRKYQRD